MCSSFQGGCPLAIGPFPGPILTRSETTMAYKYAMCPIYPPSGKNIPAFKDDDNHGMHQTGCWWSMRKSLWHSWVGLLRSLDRQPKHALDVTEQELEDYSRDGDYERNGSYACLCNGKGGDEKGFRWYEIAIDVESRLPMLRLAQRTDAEFGDGDYESYDDKTDEDEGDEDAEDEEDGGSLPSYDLYSPA